MELAISRKATAPSPMPPIPPITTMPDAPPGMLAAWKVVPPPGFAEASMSGIERAPRMSSMDRMSSPVESVTPEVSEEPLVDPSTRTAPAVVVTAVSAVASQEPAGRGTRWITIPFPRPHTSRTLSVDPAACWGSSRPRKMSRCRSGLSPVRASMARLRTEISASGSTSMSKVVVPSLVRGEREGTGEEEEGGSRSVGGPTTFTERIHGRAGGRGAAGGEVSESESVAGSESAAGLSAGNLERYCPSGEEGVVFSSFMIV
mmetsp:Transcript_14438/g.31686  ORF Transcript_14438/g.31686 Transcript_14438/m.31686 type:complete len:260 (-) Transcript_14438:438-1217(-)